MFARGQLLYIRWTDMTQDWPWHNTYKIYVEGSGCTTRYAGLSYSGVLLIHLAVIWLQGDKLRVKKQEERKNRAKTILLFTNSINFTNTYVNVYLLQWGSARKHPFPIDIQLWSKNIVFNTSYIWYLKLLYIIYIYI